LRENRLILNHPEKSQILESGDNKGDNKSCLTLSCSRESSSENIYSGRIAELF